MRYAGREEQHDVLLRHGAPVRRVPGGRGGAAGGAGRRAGPQLLLQSLPREYIFRQSESDTVPVSSADKRYILDLLVS